jgi:hypothetical protein
MGIPKLGFQHGAHPEIAMHAKVTRTIVTAVLIIYTATFPACQPLFTLGIPSLATGISFEYTFTVESHVSPT